MRVAGPKLTCATEYLLIERPLVTGITALKCYLLYTMMRLVAGLTHCPQGQKSKFGQARLRTREPSFVREGKMPDLAMIPETCPICRSVSLKQIMRKILLSVHVDGLACPSSGAFAYRCDNGHVLVVVNGNFARKEAVREGNGHTIFV